MNRFSKLLLALLLAAALSAAAPAAFPAVALWYAVLVLAHAGLGVLLTFLGWAGWRRWRRAAAGERTPLFNAGFWLLLAASAALGWALLIWGNGLHQRTLLWLHEAASALLLLGLAAAGLRRRAGLRPALRAGIAALAAAIVAVPVTLRVYRHFHPSPWSRIANRGVGYVSSQAETGNTPFAPADITTFYHGRKNAFIPESFYEDSQECQRCHPRIYREWESSAHHFSSFNNQYYSKAIQYMQQVQGTTTGSAVCAGCHDPAVLLTGHWKTPIVQQLHTRRAQAGLGCLACHGIVHVNSTLGNADFVVSDPSLNHLVHSKNPFLRWGYDAILHLDPTPHDRNFLPRFFTRQTAELCSSCHKVHLDVPDNHYRWIRGFDEYDAWQASGTDDQGARSFYYPPQPKNCAGCHMPRVRSNDPAAVNGFIRSHRFPAANTALPFVNRDRKQLSTVEHFLQGAVSTDIFALARGAGTEQQARAAPPSTAQTATLFAQGEESSQFGQTAVLHRGGKLQVIAPLDETRPTLRPGGSYCFDVVERTLRLGHFFPGGTIDAFDVWLEFKALDGHGRPFFWSGFVKPDGRIDPSAHFYHALLVDQHDHVINKRNAWSAHAAVVVRLIPPGAADTVHFRVTIPPGTPGPVTLAAKLKYRKFGYYFNRFSYAGRMAAGADSDAFDDRATLFDAPLQGVAGQLKQIPNLPIVTISADRVTLPLGRKTAATAAARRGFREVIRWNDYGIGLLLQGDLTGAGQAFRQVVRLDPKYAAGWVNLAREQLQEGQVGRAERNLNHAIRLSPDLAPAQFFRAMAEKAMGHYRAAERDLEQVLRTHPHDRVVLNQAGRLRFLQAQFRRAIPYFLDALGVDQENLMAHYNLMLCYRGLGELRRSRRQEQMYLRFKADESAQAIAGAYILKHPNADREAQPVHEHLSGMAFAGEPAVAHAWRGPALLDAGGRWPHPPAARLCMTRTGAVIRLAPLQPAAPPQRAAEAGEFRPAGRGRRRPQPGASAGRGTRPRARY